MGKYEDMSLAALLSHSVRLVRALFTDEKVYLNLSIKEAARSGGRGMALGIAGLIFLALSGIFVLVTLTLLLTVWFVPWVSALIMTILLLLCGLLLALVGVRRARSGAEKAKSDVEQAKEDIRWLKQS